MTINLGKVTFTAYTNRIEVDLFINGIYINASGRDILSTVNNLFSELAFEFGQGYQWNIQPVLVRK